MVLISLAEVSLEGGHGLVSWELEAPFSAWEIKEASCLDGVVASADHGLFRWSFSSCSGKDGAGFKLGEESLNWSWGVPGSGHELGVVI